MDEIMNEFENNIAMIESHQSKSWDAYISANPQYAYARCAERAFSFAYRSSWKNATEAMQAKLDERDEDISECDRLISKLSELLEKTAIAIRGEPPELTKYSFHDIPDRASACISLIGLQQTIIHEKDKEIEALREFAQSQLTWPMDESKYQLAVNLGLYESGNPTKLLTGE